MKTFLRICGGLNLLMGLGVGVACGRAVAELQGARYAVSAFKAAPDTLSEDVKKQSDQE